MCLFLKGKCIGKYSRPMEHSLYRSHPSGGVPSKLPFCFGEKSSEAPPEGPVEVPFIFFWNGNKREVEIYTYIYIHVYVYTPSRELAHIPPKGKRKIK